ncbi:MAG: RHS repeat-associated core domain-containing protein [Breznakibacter sp.]
MAVDPGKNTTVSYNHLNLPLCVAFPGGEKIFYHYDAAGRKLAQSIETPTGEGDKLTEYVGAAVYADGQPSFVGHEEGRTVPDNGGGWRYEYFLRDHLGNTRAVVAGTLIPGSADVLQTTSYYPFGLVMAQTDHNTVLPNYRENRYLYNGKELQGDGFGGVELGWLDYGARFYDPQIARWTTPDPLCEYHYNLAPNHYVMNNPVRFIDPFGLDTTTVVDSDGNPHFNLDEVVVTSNDKSVKKSSMPGLQLWGQGDGSQSSATPTTGRIWSSYNMMELLDLFGAFFHFKKPSKPSMEEMAGESTKAAIESLNTSDEEIKKRTTGEKTTETDRSGQTTNIEKNNQQKEMQDQQKIDTIFTIANSTPTSWALSDDKVYSKGDTMGITILYGTKPGKGSDSIRYIKY